MSRTSASLKFRASTLMRSVCRVLLHETQRAVVVTPAPDDSTFTMLCAAKSQPKVCFACQHYEREHNPEPFSKSSHDTAQGCVRKGWMMRSLRNATTPHVTCCRLFARDLDKQMAKGRASGTQIFRPAAAHAIEAVPALPLALGDDGGRAGGAIPLRVLAVHDQIRQRQELVPARAGGGRFEALCEIRRTGAASGPAQPLRPHVDGCLPC